MSVEDVTKKEVIETDAPVEAPAKEAPEESATEADMIPKTEFSKVYARAKSAEEELRTIKESQAKAEEAKLLEEKNFDAVLATKNQEIESLTAKVSKVETYETTVNGILDTMVERVPEERRSLIPDLDPVQKLDYINKNSDFLIGDVKTPKSGAPTPKNSKDPIPEEADQKRERLNELLTKSRNREHLNFEEKAEMMKLGRELSNPKG